MFGPTIGCVLRCPTNKLRDKSLQKGLFKRSVQAKVLSTLNEFIYYNEEEKKRQGNCIKIKRVEARKC